MQTNSKSIFIRCAQSDEYMSHNHEEFKRSDVIEDSEHRWLLYEKNKNDKRYTELKRKCNLNLRNGNLCEYVCVKKHVIQKHVISSKHSVSPETEIEILNKHHSKIGILLVYIYKLFIYLFRSSTIICIKEEKC